MSSTADANVDPLELAAVVVHRPLTQVGIHVEGLKAAVREGCLAIGAFVLEARVSQRVVRALLDTESFAETCDGREWAAAVTTSIPGWPSPRAAIGAPTAPPPVTWTESPS
jgi:hypothetical protein